MLFFPKNLPNKHKSWLGLFQADFTTFLGMLICYQYLPLISIFRISPISGKFNHFSGYVNAPWPCSLSQALIFHYTMLHYMNSPISRPVETDTQARALALALALSTSWQLVSIVKRTLNKKDFGGFLPICQVFCQCLHVLSTSDSFKQCRKLKKYPKFDRKPVTSSHVNKIRFAVTGSHGFFVQWNHEKLAGATM